MAARSQGCESVDFLRGVRTELADVSSLTAVIAGACSTVSETIVGVSTLTAVVATKAIVSGTLIVPGINVLVLARIAALVCTTRSGLAGFAFSLESIGHWDAVFYCEGIVLINVALKATDLTLESIDDMASSGPIIDCGWKPSLISLLGYVSNRQTCY